MGVSWEEGFQGCVGSRSKAPGSPQALGIIMTPRRKGPESNPALGITIPERSNDNYSPTSVQRSKTGRQAGIEAPG